MSKTKSDDYYSKGFELMRIEEFEDACKLFTLSISEEPSGAAFGERANCKLKLGNYKGAEEDYGLEIQYWLKGKSSGRFQDTPELNLSIYSAFSARAYAKSILDKIAEAANDLTFALAFYPKESEHLVPSNIKRGYCLANRAQFKYAMSDSYGASQDAVEAIDLISNHNLILKMQEIIESTVFSTSTLSKKESLYFTIDEIIFTVDVEAVPLTQGVVRVPIDKRSNAFLKGQVIITPVLDLYEDLKIMFPVTLNKEMAFEITKHLIGRIVKHIDIHKRILPLDVESYIAIMMLVKRSITKTLKYPSISEQEGIDEFDRTYEIVRQFISSRYPSLSIERSPF
jgi:tetratricopeptide (TPR) repeat protein